jgi:hypothetical protein
VPCCCLGQPCRATDGISGEAHPASPHSRCLIIRLSDRAAADRAQLGRLASARFAQIAEATIPNMMFGEHETPRLIRLEFLALLVQSRRDTDHSAVSAQIDMYGIPSDDSYLGCMASRHALGNACRIRRVRDQR